MGGKKEIGAWKHLLKNRGRGGGRELWEDEKKIDTKIGYYQCFGTKAVEIKG